MIHLIPIAILTIEDEGDRNFIERLYLDYERLLFSETQKITKNLWDSQDVVQAVLVKIIHDRIPLLRSLSERKRVNYLITACHNTAYNIMRKKKAEIPFSLDDETAQTVDQSFSDSHSVEDLLVMSNQIDTFAKIWEDLDEKTKYFIGARYILEQSIEEIAKELDITPANARVALSRARQKVRKQCTKADISPI